jgi:hypothetical protein
VPDPGSSRPGREAVPPNADPPGLTPPRLRPPPGLPPGVDPPPFIVDPSILRFPAGSDRPPPPADHTVVLRRREDQLHLELRFYGLELSDDTGGPVLRRSGRDVPVVVVVFPRQHVLEEASYEVDSRHDPSSASKGVPYPSPPVAARLSGATRLAFTVPDRLLPLPYTMASLLDWGRWLPRLVPAALGPQAGARVRPAPRLRAPAHDETAIELPLFLQLSPHADAGWVHAAEPIRRVQPVTGRASIELWHTRLAGRPPGTDAPDETDRTHRVVRAVWTRDPLFGQWLDSGGNDALDGAGGEQFPQLPGFGFPFRSPLSPEDRYDTVVSTADFAHRISGRSYTPTPLEVEHLHLTSLGGTLDARGAWQAGKQLATQSGTSLQSLRYQATLGRDHYVRVVRSGYLAPFGHGASLIKVTERKFGPYWRSEGAAITVHVGAFLRQRYFIVVRQPLRVYGAHDHVHARDLPFSRLRFTTLVTPDIAAPTSLGVPGLSPTEAFVPRVGAGQAPPPFPFQYTAVDRSGRLVSGTTPVVFVDAVKAHDAGAMQKLRVKYSGLPVDVRTTDLRGQLVAYAPPSRPGDTDVTSHALQWGIKAPDGTPRQLAASDQPLFLPRLDRVTVRLQAVEAALGGPLTGPGGTGDGSTAIVYHPHYVGAGNGFDDNLGEVFVELADQANPVHLDFGRAAAGDRAGGVATPNLAIRALSRASGPIGGDPAAFRQGKVDPASFFGGAAATLLGDIRLADVVAPLAGVGAHDDRVLRITTVEQPGPPLALETTVSWRPELQPFRPVLELLDAASLSLLARTVVPFGGGVPTTELTGELRNVEIRLLGDEPFLRMQFDLLRFHSVDGRKPDLEVAIRDVLFAGPLRFVNELRDLLRFGGDTLAIDVRPTHATATLTVAVPTVAVGIFSLQNITFVAGLTVPFTGEPVRARFAFCSMESPFLLTVMIFGGGGFLELGVGADGVESLQAALEFGGSVSLDVGVASGGVELMAGIYLAIGVPSPTNTDGDLELTGYVRVKGRVSVLGIITVTLTLKLALTYLRSQDKAIGKATMIVEVEVLFFSGSVEVTVERRFGGSSDPTFGEVLDANAWAAHCGAFAPA